MSNHSILRGLAVALVAALLAAGPAIPSTAAGTKTKPRVVEAPYLTPVIGGSVTTDYNGTTAYYYDCLNEIGCAIIDVNKGESFATLEIVDAAGQAVHGYAYAMPGGHELGHFCGKTRKPIYVGFGKEILVHVISGTCQDGETSIATHGVVRATLTRK
jgi:hypothetical protein